MEEARAAHRLQTPTACQASVLCMLLLQRVSAWCARARTHAHTHTHTHTCAKCILASLCAVWPEGKAVCADCAVACGHRFGLPVASCLGYVSAGLGAWPGCGAAEVRGSSVRELKAVHAGTMPSHPLVGPLCPKGGTEPIKRLSLISSSLDLDRASAPHAASVR